jgi:hypothetical protein
VLAVAHDTPFRAARHRPSVHVTGVRIDRLTLDLAELGTQMSFTRSAA